MNRYPHWDELSDVAGKARDNYERLRAELAEVDARLDAAIYESSKDWRYSDRPGRIDWLHAMYVGKSQESDMWVAQIITLCAELTEARKPDCRTCFWHGHISEVCNRAGGAKKCGGVRYVSTPPLRLYEKEEK